jgi:hypothetical protein
VRAFSEEIKLISSGERKFNFYPFNVVSLLGSLSSSEHFPFAACNRVDPKKEAKKIKSNRGKIKVCESLEKQKENKWQICFVLNAFVKFQTTKDAVLMSLMVAL